MLKRPKMKATVELTCPNGDILNADPQPDHSPTPTLERQPKLKSSTSTDSHLETWKLPHSAWTPQCHPRAKEVARDVDNYFLQHWNFPNQKSKRTFLNAGFSQVTCLYFPKAKDDRIEYACRLLTVLFLIDGEERESPLPSFFPVLEREERVAKTVADYDDRHEDQLEKMSLEEGKAFNEKLMPIIRGSVQPDRK